MTVEKVYYDGQLHDAIDPITGNNPIMQIMNFSNDTKIQEDGTMLGDPTETALVAYGETKDFDLPNKLAEMPRINEVPFDSERKLMTTIHQLANGQYLWPQRGRRMNCSSASAELSIMIM